MAAPGEARAVAYQRARSDGRGSSGRRWPRASPGSSAGAGWGPCPSVRRRASSRPFSSAVRVSHGVPSAALPLPTTAAYLAILELEDQRHLVAGNLLVDDLGGDPAVGRVGLPCPRARLVDVCHVGGAVPRPLVLGGAALSGSKCVRVAAAGGPARGGWGGRGWWSAQRANSLHSQRAMHGSEECVRVEAAACSGGVEHWGHGLLAGTLLFTANIPLAARANNAGAANHTRPSKSAHPRRRSARRRTPEPRMPESHQLHGSTRSAPVCSRP
jgi:hypothetical protein